MMNYRHPNDLNSEKGKGKIISFPNIGFLIHKFDDEELHFLRKDVDKIKQNLESTANKKHSGNIEYEFFLPDSRKELEKLIFPYFIEYDKQHNFINSYFKDISSGNIPITLNSCWVNFQKKHEFISMHDHSGIMSFVIYLDVPYYIEDEMNNPSTKNSTVNTTAHFEFHYTNSFGSISSLCIPVDKRFKNTMLLFPASFKHSVNPFYTSDDYRICVSGNFMFNPYDINTK